MSQYLVSFLAGTVVGLLYALARVPAPAPPIVALVGLLGILLGEQIPPLARRLAARRAAATAVATARPAARWWTGGTTPSERAGRSHPR